MHPVVTMDGKAQGVVEGEVGVDPLSTLHGRVDHLDAAGAKQDVHRLVVVARPTDGRQPLRGLHGVIAEAGDTGMVERSAQLRRNPLALAGAGVLHPCLALRTEVDERLRTHRALSHLVEVQQRLTPLVDLGLVQEDRTEAHLVGLVDLRRDLGAHHRFGSGSSLDDATQALVVDLDVRLAHHGVQLVGFTLEALTRHGAERQPGDVLAVVLPGHLLLSVHLAPRALDAAVLGEDAGRGRDFGHDGLLGFLCSMRPSPNR